jgi:uncharacterized protein YigE (DUF2233 family)
MKKWIFGFIASLCLVGMLLLFVKDQIRVKESNVLPAKTSVNTPIPSPVAIKQSIVINFNDIPMRIAWVKVNPQDVKLYSNLKDQKLSEEIYVDKSCSVLVSGGFYSEENTHLGLFVTNFEAISETSQSATRNGFLLIDSNEKLTISSAPPKITPKIALQSGPLLMLNNEVLPLKINNDEPNRRVVAAKTFDNKLIFIAIYRDNSDFQGPMLGDLPEIINLFSEKTGINVVDAINLDGGIHSIFISDYIRLNEFAHIGSYFCIK